MSSNKRAASNLPFLLKPAAKDYLWGGNRLNDDFAKGIAASPLAETWECSTHPDGVSVVNSGPFCGRPLTDVLRAHPEYLGAHAEADGALPVLIKLIDAKSDLSVQVHPDDAYAMAHENGQRGKTELWYVLAAGRDASIVYGLHHDAGKDAVRRSIENGTVGKYLQRVPVKANDVFLVEPGTVHAIGAGVLLAEIQESSNLTYRLYDYDRVDKTGQKRALHVDKALAVAKLQSSAEPRQPMRVLRYQPGCASELLCRCRYFQTERLLINTERCRELFAVRADGLSFFALLCVDGCGVLNFEGESLGFFKGDCVFVPADSASVRIHGKAQLLKVSC